MGSQIQAGALKFILDRAGDILEVGLDIGKSEPYSPNPNRIPVINRI